MIKNVMVLLSGGPDSLSEALYQLEEKNKKVHLVTLVPGNSFLYAENQKEILARCGYDFTSEVCYFHKPNGIYGETLLASIPTLAEIIVRNNIDEVYTGGSTDDENETLPWQEMAEILAKYVYILSKKHIIVDPESRKIPTKQEVHTFLGPLWDFTHSCVVSTEPCKRCHKCNQRRRAGSQESKLKWQEKDMTAITQWIGSETFKELKNHM